MEICTTCPYCGVGCGVVAMKDAQGNITVKGDEGHPANFGKLCSKGSALAETLGVEDRLLYPSIKGVRASWDSALDKIAEGFSKAIKNHGPDSVALYVSGQFLTEDYYIANKLMKGYIGSANIDTNSRLCMASSVVGHKRAFGADIVPGCYEDLEQAELIILVGSNLAWCHPIIYQRIVKAKAKNSKMKIVVIDPRRTASCDLADLHLALAPGTDVVLFLGLLNYLEDAGLADTGFILSHTENYSQAIETARPHTVKSVSKATGLSAQLIEQFYRLYADTTKTVSVYSQGVNQARDGSDKVNAIINCHLLTGRIGKVGAGPFSVTGQPNAMGGREVGGLANQLASHMDIENNDHRDLIQRYWGSPTMASKQGLKAVDLFEAVHTGKVKAIWIMATNPVDSMPNANFVREALQRCDLVVVSDIVGHTDTAACADIVLPSTGWSEKEGTVTNSERRISRQRAFLPASGEARHDWWQLCELAKRLGFENGFSFNSPAEIFGEYAGLSGFENAGRRALDLSALKDLSRTEYDALNPVQWPINEDEPEGMSRFFMKGKYFTKSGKANFVSTPPLPPIESDPEFPFLLNTGRLRDHWHTMTRTGRSARLSQHIAESFVELHPMDGLKIGVGDADIATLSTRQGEIQARVILTKRQRPGSAFTPIHFTDRFTANSRVDALTHNLVDKVSGQPAFKSTALAIKKFPAIWYGFSVIASDIFEAVKIPEEAKYWAKARIDAGVRIELAGISQPNSFTDFFHKLLGKTGGYEVLEMTMPARHQTRLAAFDNGRLIALFFADQDPVKVSRDWACDQLSKTPDASERYKLLAGRPGADMPDKGAIVCSCMSVGVNEINAAIEMGCRSVSSIGEKTSAGTNCGSCQSEIRSILKEASLVPTA